MTRAMLRSCVAICAVVMSMECYGQKVDSLAAKGDTVFWTKGGALYSWKVTDKDNKRLQASGWSANSKIAINGGQIVYTASDNLVRKSLSNLDALPTLIDANGWDSDAFCMAHGNVYWAHGGNLFQWDMDKNHPNSRISKKMVAGDSRVVVDGQYVYWVKGDDLMKAPLNDVDGSVQIANTGGWKDTKKLAASNGVLYFTKDGNLYRNNLSTMNGEPALDTNGWD